MVFIGQPERRPGLAPFSHICWCLQPHYCPSFIQSIPQLDNMDFFRKLYNDQATTPVPTRSNMASTTEHTAGPSPIQILPTTASTTVGATLTPNSTDYRYNPLDETIDSIRLLVLHPSKRRDPQIRCDLVHATFSDKPVYEALSYTWGTDHPRNLIFINEIQYYVRDNLYHALCGLRLKDSPRNLWVDAVCIDQGSMQERAYQVGLMDFIYARAHTVLVWLGAEIRYKEQLSVKSFLCRGDRRFDDFQLAVCKHPYWRRLWIIQEIVLARAIIICIGKDTKEWKEFVGSFELVRTMDTEEQFTEGRHLIQQLNERHIRRHDDSNRLEVLLQDFEYALCLERRDKIYGLLGLAQDCQDGSILVDYSKAYYEVYCDVIKFFIKKRPLANGAANEFDRSMRLVKFSQLLQRLLQTNYLQREIPCNSKTYVTIQGALVGRVIHIGPTYEEMISSRQSNKKWISSFADYNSQPQELTSRREANEAYMATLLSMNSQDVAKIHNVYPNASQQMFWSRAMVTTKRWRDKQYHWEGGALGDDISLAIADAPILQAPNTTETQPRMFLGSNLHMGVSPSDTQIGDIICQFWETDTVALLRKEGELYRVVGRVDLCRGRLEQLKPIYEPWNSIPETANQIIMQMDIDMLSFLTY